MSQLWRKIVIKSGNGLEGGYPRILTHTHTRTHTLDTPSSPFLLSSSSPPPPFLPPESLLPFIYKAEYFPFNAQQHIYIYEYHFWEAQTSENLGN